MNAKQRYELAKKEAAERLELANKHNTRNYWIAAEAAAQDAVDYRSAYRNTMSEEERTEFDRQGAEECLRFLSQIAR